MYLYNDFKFKSQFYCICTDEKSQKVSKTEPSVPKISYIGMESLESLGGGAKG